MRRSEATGIFTRLLAKIYLAQRAAQLAWIPKPSAIMNLPIFPKKIDKLLNVSEKMSTNISHSLSISVFFVQLITEGAPSSPFRV